MRLSGAVVAAGVLAGCAAPEPQGPLTARVAAVEDWAVFAEEDGEGELICWVAAPPVGARPETGRGEVWLMTAVSPETLPGPEVSYVGGWPLANGTVRLEVAGQTYDFFVDGPVAWIDDEYLEPDLVADLRRSREAMARSVSMDGRVAADRFSLMGYTDALAEAERLCEAGTV